MHAAVRAFFTSEAELWRILCTKRKGNQGERQTRREEKTPFPNFVGGVFSRFSCVQPKAGSAKHSLEGLLWGIQSRAVVVLLSRVIGH